MEYDKLSVEDKALIEEWIFYNLNSFRSAEDMYATMAAARERLAASPEELQKLRDAWKDRIAPYENLNSADKYLIKLATDRELAAGEARRVEHELPPLTPLDRQIIINSSRLKYSGPDELARLRERASTDLLKDEINQLKEEISIDHDDDAKRHLPPQGEGKIQRQR